MTQAHDWPVTSMQTAIRVLFAAALSSGCSAFTSSDCVSLGRLGVQVTVLDTRTNQTPAGTVVTISDGDYRETLTRSGAVYLGAAERPGVYAVIVDAPGYARWTRNNVRVARSGDCNYLQSVRLSSELQPTG